MKRKWLAIALSMVLAVGMLSGCGDSTETPATDDTQTEETTEEATEETTEEETPAVDVVEDGGGKVLNIYAWNEDIVKQLEAHMGMKDNKIGDVEVNVIVNAQADNVFTDKLTEALTTQDSKDADDKADLVLLDAGFAKRYTTAAADLLYTMPQIGITDDDMADIYDSSKRLTTDENGQVRALGFQATGCAVYYRKDFAKEALGTDDPAEVQAMMSDWDGLKDVAAKLKDKGHFLIDNPIDLEYIFVNPDTEEIGADGKIALTQGMSDWLDYTKELCDAESVKRPAGKFWEDDWYASATTDGNVFMYSGPGWFLNGCLSGWAGDDQTGNWAAIVGPQAYWWGGTYFGVAKGSDNVGLCKEIIDTIIINPDGGVKQYDVDGSYPTNKKAAETLMANGGANDFLGGQNILEVYNEANDAIGDYTVGPYDVSALEGCFGIWGDFFTGKIDKDTVVGNFEDEMIKLYPNLTK